MPARARGRRSSALGRFGPGCIFGRAQILRLALETGCEAIHPGYGFLSENSAFARLCNNAGSCSWEPPLKR
ncbi:MAG: biotin carboxylase N-terminal domain-containing protein [Steroidobacteraceae bacterium]